MTLRPRDQLPMFTVTSAVDGTAVEYRLIWQLRNLVLASLPAEDPSSRTYMDTLRQAAHEIEGHQAVLVVTFDRIPGVPSPGVVVADRWGEIHHIEGARRSGELPAPPELVSWLEHVQHICPECQGETL